MSSVEEVIDRVAGGCVVRTRGDQVVVSVGEDEVLVSPGEAERLAAIIHFAADEIERK